MTYTTRKDNSATINHKIVIRVIILNGVSYYEVSRTTVHVVNQDKIQGYKQCVLTSPIRNIIRLRRAPNCDGLKLRAPRCRSLRASAKINSWPNVPRKILLYKYDSYLIMFCTDLYVFLQNCRTRLTSKVSHKNTVRFLFNKLGKSWLFKMNFITVNWLEWLKQNLLYWFSTHESVFLRST